MWDPSSQDRWFLISDRPAGRQRIAEYAWRTRVEATFQDSKSRGWNLEASHLADRDRLDHLLLALFLAVWWVTHLAAACIHHGHRTHFDRHDRRDKGIFRLGRLWLLNIHIPMCSERHCLGWPFSPARQTLPGRESVEAKQAILAGKKAGRMGLARYSNASSTLPKGRSSLK